VLDPEEHTIVVPGVLPHGRARTETSQHRHQDASEPPGHFGTFWDVWERKHEVRTVCASPGWCFLVEVVPADRSDLELQTREVGGHSGRANLI
jgi:hypothetical protein